MFCTDSLERVTADGILKATQTIPAQNIYIVRLDEPVAEFFKLNYSLWVFLCPQELHAFSENRNAGVLSPGGPCRSHNEITQDFQKSDRIRHAIDHDFRERFSRIQCDVSPLLNRGTDVPPLRLEPWAEALPV